MNEFFLKRKEIKCVDTGEICIGYESYLKSKHWTKLRIQMLSKHPVCIHCQEEKHGLQVHHSHYNTLGDENLDNDLYVLCNVCHKLIHHAKNKWQPETNTNKEPIAQKKQQQKSCQNCYYISKVTLHGSRKKRIEPICNYHYKMNPDAICNKWKSNEPRPIKIYYGRNST